MDQNRSQTTFDPNTTRVDELRIIKANTSKLNDFVTSSDMSPNEAVAACVAWLGIMIGSSATDPTDLAKRLGAVTNGVVETAVGTAISKDDEGAGADDDSE